MDTSNYYPNKYISSEDLKGRDVTVTIVALKSELMKERNSSQEKPKPVLYFQGTKKGCVVNKTNLKTLWKIFSSKNSDDWLKKRIVLYSIPVTFGDEIRDGIRIKAAGNGNGTVTSAAPATPAIDPNDDVPPFDIPDGDADEDIPDEENPFK